MMGPRVIVLAECLLFVVLRFGWRTLDSHLGVSVQELLPWHLLRPQQGSFLCKPIRKCQPSTEPNLK